MHVSAITSASAGHRARAVRRPPGGLARRRRPASWPSGSRSPSAATKTAARPRSTEANAIGTTYLRAQLIAEPARSRSLDLLRRYTDRAIAVSHGGAGQRRACDARPPPGRAPATAVAPRRAGDRRRAGRQRAAALRRQPQRHDRLAAPRLAALNNRVPGAVLALEVSAPAVALGLLALHISVLGRGLVPMLAAAGADDAAAARHVRPRPADPWADQRALDPARAVRASMALPPAAPARSTSLKGGAQR